MEECYLDAVTDADAKTYINGFAESALGYYDNYYCGAGKVDLPLSLFSFSTADSNPFAITM